MRIRSVNDHPVFLAGRHRTLRQWRRDLPVIDLAIFKDVAVSNRHGRLSGRVEPGRVEPGCVRPDRAGCSPPWVDVVRFGVLPLGDVIARNRGRRVREAVQW